MGSNLLRACAMPKNIVHIGSESRLLISASLAARWVKITSDSIAIASGGPLKAPAGCRLQRGFGSYHLLGLAMVPV